MLYKHTRYYPAFGVPTNHDSDPAVFEIVRSYGNKIPAQQAHDLFPEIEAQELRYRR